MNLGLREIRSMFTLVTHIILDIISLNHGRWALVTLVRVNCPRI